MSQIIKSGVLAQNTASKIGRTLADSTSLPGMVVKAGATKIVGITRLC
jgi:hypothetical protein